MGWDLNSLPLRHQQAIREQLLGVRTRTGENPIVAASDSATRDRPHSDVESDLHDRVYEWCRSHALYAVHSRMDRRTTQAKGVPDYLIAFPHGVTLWLELKRPKGKATPEQSGALLALNVLGHISAMADNWQYALGVLEETMRVANERTP